MHVLVVIAQLAVAGEHREALLASPEHLAVALFRVIEGLPLGGVLLAAHPTGVRLGENAGVHLLHVLLQVLWILHGYQANAA